MASGDSEADANGLGCNLGRSFLLYQVETNVNRAPFMNSQKKCPQCGATLAADAPEGLCPKCLLQQGLEAALPGPLQGEAAAGKTL